MRGYVSFVLVFLAASVMLSAYGLQSATRPDLSRAVSAERAYGLQMDIKQSATESIRQGALEGFTLYDNAHDVDKCIHCPGACLPPPAPNRCDPAICALCFREDEARESAISGAQDRLAALAKHSFDGQFQALITAPSMDVLLRPDPARHNGFSIDYTVLRSPLSVSVRSESLEISAFSELPGGLVIR
ncbi:MAG: hypothetical protein AB1295_00025 [Candidatus Micrarchaeota archaeon]